MHNTFAVQTAV